MSEKTVTPLLLVGTPDAAACEGDFCAVPEQRDRALVNERLDADLV